MPGEDLFNQQSREFLDWLKSRGVEISPKIDIHDYRDSLQGRGIIALEDIKEDETIFTIPRGAVLSVDADLQQKFASKVPEILELDNWMSLMLYMIYQGGLSDGEFAPYFAVLPKEFSTLMYWEQTEAEELLAGSTLVTKIGKEEAEESFRTKLLPIIEAHKDVFEGIDVSVDAFHRMGSLIMSYSFDVNRFTPEKDTAMEEEKEDDDEAHHMSIDMSVDGAEAPDSESEGDESHDLIEVQEEVDDDSDDEEEFPVKAMVPLADTLNAHSKLCNAHLCQEGNSLVMRATSDIPKGAQVYNTYGDFPNGDLLRRYGYVETGGTDSDIVEIKIEDIVSAVEQAASSTKFPVKEGAVMELVSQLAEWEDDILEIVDDSYDVQLNGTPGSDIMVLISYLTFATVRNKDYKALKRSLKAPSATPENNRKILKRFITDMAKNSAKGLVFKESLPIWQTICTDRIAKYPKEIQSGSFKQEETASSKERVILSHKGMANEVLAGEVRILQKCLEWVNDAQTIPIEDLEYQPKDAAGSKRKIGYGPKGNEKKAKRRA